MRALSLVFVGARGMEGEEEGAGGLGARCVVVVVMLLWAWVVGLREVGVGMRHACWECAWLTWCEVTKGGGGVGSSRCLEGV